MRIGTLNLEGKWGDRHSDLLLSCECDVWLLTEVRMDTQLDGYCLHATKHLMGPEKYWAAILGRASLKELDDPHPASAAAIIGTNVFCSTVLPWRACGAHEPWVGKSLAEKTEATLKILLKALNALPQSGLVWGGDFNQELEGRIYTGSREGRRHISDALEKLQLSVPTKNQPHRLGGKSIDHIAVPKDWLLGNVLCVETNKLSDHDAYIVDIVEEQPTV